MQNNNRNYMTVMLFFENRVRENIFFHTYILNIASVSKLFFHVWVSHCNIVYHKYEYNNKWMYTGTHLYDVLRFPCNHCLRFMHILVLSAAVWEVVDLALCGDQETEVS